MMSVTHERRIADGPHVVGLDVGRLHPRRRPPPPPAGRRILVQVAGIGSTSEQAAVADVDHTGLGYAASRRGAVLLRRRSRAGGRTGRVPWPGSPPPPTRPRTARPTCGCRRRGWPACSTRWAGPSRACPSTSSPTPRVVWWRAWPSPRPSGGGRLPPAVATLVTLATPHQGADLAHAVVAGRLSDRGQRLVADARARLGIDLDPSAPAAAQLAPTSAVIDELRSLAPPASVRVVSVGARGDLVVPANRTAAAGAASTVVSLSGPRAHDRLPGSPEASREIALAIAGRGPTCRSLVATALDLGISERISRAESMLALPGVGASLLEVEP